MYISSQHPTQKKHHIKKIKSNSAKIKATEVPKASTERSTYLFSVLFFTF
jgi:hypothetical protein